MKKQARDIAKTSNGNVDQAEYLYEFAKSFGDCSLQFMQKKNESSEAKAYFIGKTTEFL